MRRSPTRLLRGVALVHRGDLPLYRQICEHMRAAIRTGQLRPGDRVPSTRDLAAQFSTARGTVDTAYAILAGEGYFIGRGAAGTIVNTELDRRAVAGAASQQRPRSRTEPPPKNAPRPLQMGLPALDAFPRKLWSRLVARHARAFAPSDMAYPEPSGYPPLREAIAVYLATSRGVRCTAGQILITNGYQDALNLAASVLLRPGDKIWVEDPGYPPTAEALKATGAALVPIRVDAEGVRVSEGVARARRARLAVVTPSHQSPLGVALSLPRRLALLSWASGAGAWIIEDDYDSEFRYVGRPLPALKSLDQDERVLYVGTFSKVLYPGLRLGYLVVPESLIDVFIRSIRMRHLGHGTLEQRVVADFMAAGHFARHFKRMRALYGARRRTLADSLSQVFGDRITVELRPGGMHLIVRLARGLHDVELASLAQACGFAVEALSRRAMTHECGQGLLLGFTNVAESDARDVCERLHLAIGSRLARDSDRDAHCRPRKAATTRLH
jgi:GntR family transcriptional regulator/MocR family aminotransferase